MPNPEKHVFICVQSRPPGHPRGSCAQRGAMEVYQAMAVQLEQGGLSRRFAVTNTGCLGPCDTGANMIVYPDGIMYGGVKPEDVPAIISEHLVGGKPVERLKVPAMIWE